MYLDPRNKRFVDKYTKLASVVRNTAQGLQKPPSTTLWELTMQSFLAISTERIYCTRNEKSEERESQRLVYNGLLAPSKGHDYHGTLSI